MPEESSPLKTTLLDAMKSAMRSGEKERLGTIRLILAAVKQIEVDERKALSDEDILVILDKLAKQRRESISQYTEAGRDDLANQEKTELAIIQEFLPQPLTEEEVEALIKSAIEETGAESIKDMGKVMGILKPKLQGRADMGKASGAVKALLG